MLALPAKGIFDVCDMQKDNLSLIVGERYIFPIEVHCMKIRGQSLLR
jgi:hypothetical protein